MLLYAAGVTGRTGGPKALVTEGMREYVGYRFSAIKNNSNRFILYSFNILHTYMHM